MATETMTESVIKQIAEKFRYFDVEVTSERHLSNFGLKIYKKKQQNPHRRDTISSVAWVRQSRNWFEIESVNEGAPPYVKKLEGDKFGSRPQLEMAVRHEAFWHEARQLLAKEAQEVLQRNSLSNDSGRQRS